LGLLGGQDAIAEGDGEKGADGSDALGCRIRTVAGGRAGGAKGIEQRGIDQPQDPGRRMVGPDGLALRAGRSLGKRPPSCAAGGSRSPRAASRNCRKRLMPVR
jgi:hypothetical protein